MPGPWYDSATLQADIASRLSVAALAPKWLPIADAAVQTAYTDLRNILAAKGYTAEQMDQWDDRVSYSRDQAMFWAHVNGGLLTNQPDTASKLDRRDELRKAGAIMIAGKLVTPGATDSAVGVGSGDMTQVDGGINYGTTFGLRTRRAAGANQYGDPLYPGRPAEGAQ
jgi:hypothetical protein